MPIQKISREEMMRAAAEVFRKQGYHRTSMADLAEACGLTKGVFYHHFESKEELMKAILESVHAYFNATLFSLAYSETYSPEEKLNSFLHKAQKIFFGGAGGCLMGNTVLETADTTQDFVPYLQAFFRDWVSALAAIYQSVYEEDAAKRIAEQTVQEFEGAVMFYRLYGEKRYLTEAVERARFRLLGDGASVC
jgi:TetR/AcrR family transcriptional repressor of nem operon